MAAKTRIGREMSHHHPGTSAGRRLLRLDGSPEAGDEAIPESSHDHFLAASLLEIDPPQEILEEIPSILAPRERGRLHPTDRADPVDPCSS